MKKVLLHVGREAHPIYREQMHFAPAEFEYVPDHPDLSDEERLKRDIASAGSRAHTLRSHLTRAAVVVSSRSGAIPRRRLIPKPGIDLIHSGQALLDDSAVPYVVDFEDVHVFAYYQTGTMTRPWARRALRQRMSTSQCRALLPWTEAAREGLLNALGEAATAEVQSKLRTVLPAVRARVQSPPRRPDRSKPLRVLFIGKDFIGKGGPEALEAIGRVRDAHDVALDLVTLLPQRWRGRVAAMPAVTLHEKIGAPELRSLYSRADVLLFPAHVDTLGWVVFEAFSHALPVLAASHFCLPELVEDGVSGLIFTAENSLYDERRLPRYPWLNPARLPSGFRAALARPGAAYVDRIAAAVARVAVDLDLREQLAVGALDRVTNGPLSPDRRRSMLSEVYATALTG